MLRSWRRLPFRLTLHGLITLVCVASLLGPRVGHFLRYWGRPTVSWASSGSPLAPLPGERESEDEEEQRAPGGEWRQGLSNLIGARKARLQFSATCVYRRLHLLLKSIPSTARLCRLPTWPVAWFDPFHNGLGAPYLC